MTKVVTVLFTAAWITLPIFASGTTDDTWSESINRTTSSSCSTADTNATSTCASKGSINTTCSSREGEKISREMKLWIEPSYIPQLATLSRMENC